MEDDIDRIMVINEGIEAVSRCILYPVFLSYSPVKCRITVYLISYALYFSDECSVGLRK